MSAKRGSRIGKRRWKGRELKELNELNILSYNMHNLKYKNDDCDVFNYITAFDIFVLS